VQNTPEHNRAEQSRAEQNRTEQNRTEQSSAEQNRAAQDRTEYNRTCISLKLLQFLVTLHTYTTIDRFGNAYRQTRY